MTYEEFEQLTEAEIEEIKKDPEIKAEAEAMMKEIQKIDDQLHAEYTEKLKQLKEKKFDDAVERADAINRLWFEYVYELPNKLYGKLYGYEVHPEIKINGVEIPLKGRHAHIPGETDEQQIERICRYEKADPKELDKDSFYWCYSLGIEKRRK